MRFYSRALLPSLLVLGTLHLPSCGQPEAETSVSEPAPEAASGQAGLSADIPFDVTVGESDDLASVQHDFDELSWKTFVAINWPSMADGQPDLLQQPGAQKDNATVWESWREASTIFLAQGTAPAPWGGKTTPATLPAVCRDLLKPGMRVLMQVGKTPGLLSESVDPFDTGPLIDQHGRYARFEILVNESMFKTIFDQKLYSKAAQQSAANVVFECGSKDAKKVGAIMVKAAWKILSEDEENSGRFHTTEALVYTPPSTDPKLEEKCELAKVGLVGLHIAHKTVGAPQWIWSTFEHVDNCPTARTPSDRPAYSFYNKATPDAQQNTPPKRPWDPSVIEPPDRRAQIVRMTPIDEATQKLNVAWQGKLRDVNPNSVWQHYELISTQWPTQPADDCDVEQSAPTNMSGAPAPQFLANTTLETYIQGQVPNVSSSCIECHLNATTTAAKFSDFTYLLERAQ